MPLNKISVSIPFKSLLYVNWMKVVFTVGHNPCCGQSKLNTAAWLDETTSVKYGSGGIIQLQCFSLVIAKLIQVDVDGKWIQRHMPEENLRLGRRFILQQDDKPQHTAINEINYN